MTEPGLLYSPTEPHTQDIDVFLKRDIETGFGFRVLGGEAPEQPVRTNTQSGRFSTTHSHPGVAMATWTWDPRQNVVNIASNVEQNWKLIS